MIGYIKKKIILIPFESKKFVLILIINLKDLILIVFSESIKLF